MLLIPLSLLLLAQTAARGPAAGNSAFEALAQQAAQARDAGRLDEAAERFGRALKIRPAWDEGWWNLGSIAYDRDKYSECAHAFQKFTTLQPGVSPGWIMAGLCEYKLRHFAQAREDLTRAERLHFEGPTELSRAARLHFAIVLTKTGAYEKALMVLTELTRLDRKTPEIAVAAGIAGLRKAWLPSEVPEADRDRVSKVGEAMATAMEMDFKSAISKFEEALHDYPADPDVHFRFGAFLMQQAPERGMEEIQKALDLEPAHMPALLGLAMIYLKSGDSEKAIGYSSKAVLAEPGDFATHVALGRSYLDADDLPRAVDQLTIAVKLAPDSADAHFSLASAYSRLGRKADAEKEQTAFRQLRSLTDAAHP